MFDAEICCPLKYSRQLKISRAIGINIVGVHPHAHHYTHYLVCAFKETHSKKLHFWVKLHENFLKQSAPNDLILFEPCIDKEAAHEKRFCVTANEFACTHVICAEVIY